MAVAPELLVTDHVAAPTKIDPRTCLFDADWNRATYPDVAAANVDPFEHVLCNGSAEGRNPNALSDRGFHKSIIPDVVASA